MTTRDALVRKLETALRHGNDQTQRCAAIEAYAFLQAWDPPDPKAKVTTWFAGHVLDTLKAASDD